MQYNEHLKLVKEFFKKVEGKNARLFHYTAKHDNMTIKIDYIGGIYWVINFTMCEFAVIKPIWKIHKSSIEVAEKLGNVIPLFKYRNDDIEILCQDITITQEKLNNNLPKSLEELLALIRKKPGLYLGSKSITNLDNFITGWRYGMGDLNYDNSIFNDFTNWLKKKYSVSLSYNWAGIILFNTANNENIAFDKFFVEFEEYKRIVNSQK